MLFGNAQSSSAGEKSNGNIFGLQPFQFAVIDTPGVGAFSWLTPQTTVGNTQYPPLAPDLQWMVRSVVEIIRDRNEPGWIKWLLGLGSGVYVIRQHSSDVTNLAKGLPREWVFDDRNELPSREKFVAMLEAIAKFKKLPNIPPTKIISKPRATSSKKSKLSVRPRAQPGREA